MIIRDSIYGDISFSDNEELFIKSFSFNRLRRIKQLSFSEYIYPCATHNRYSHSLGVCYCVSKMFDIIQQKTHVFKDTDRELIRFIALAHDIGHSPFSHSSEVLSTITHEERMEDILRYEKKSIKLNKKYSIPAYAIISQVYNGEGSEYIGNSRLMLLHTLMDNIIDADKIDYLIRDANHCGVSYGVFDRDSLLNSLTVREINGVLRLCIEIEGLQALENFVLARYYMFTQVYFHPKRRLLDFLFIKEIRKILGNSTYPKKIQSFLQWDDTKVLPKLANSKEFNRDYKLVYDADFNIDHKVLIDSELGEFLICDTPKQSIFKKYTNANDVYVVDKLMNRVVPASELSPLLKSIEYSSIHKLRYYAPTDIADEIHKQIFELIGGNIW